MAELDLTNIASTSISTPASGVSAVYVDNVTKTLNAKIDTGTILSEQITNSGSTAAQTPAATTRTYITGTKLAVGAGKLQVGSMFRWRWNMTKTGAGTSASTIDVAVGTAGTTADTARLSFTKPAGTGVIDEAWCEVTAIVRGPLSASGVMVGEFTMGHNLSATGHATIPYVAVNTVSGTFDVTVANLFLGVCITTGSLDVITIQFATGEAWNI